MEVSHNNWSVREFGQWSILTVNGRLDAFNFDTFCLKFEELLNLGKNHIVVDLSQARFLSLPSIKYLNHMAAKMSKIGGRMALMSASEKLKRQIDIYASLNQIWVVRSTHELGKDANGGPSL